MRILSASPSKFADDFFFFTYLSLLKKKKLKVSYREKNGSLLRNRISVTTIPKRLFLLHLSMSKIFFLHVIKIE